MNIFNKFSKKQTVSVLIAIVTVLFNFITPLFPLLSISTKRAGISYLIGYATMNNAFSVEGYGDIYSWFGIYTLILVILSVIITAIYAFIVVTKDASEVLGISIGAIGASALLSLVYLINGFIAVADYNDMIGSMKGYTVLTGAFIPMLIMVVLCAAFFAVLKFMPDDAAPQTSESANEEN